MASLHQIRNLSFEIETNSEASAKEDIQTLENLIKRRLLSTIEKVFDEIALEDASLRINALTLDLGDIDIYQMDSEVEYKLRHALFQQLTEIVEAKPEAMDQFQATLEPEIKKTEDWLQVYLTTGLIPWWKQVHQLTKQDITEEIYLFFEASPDQFRRFILKNISLPQVLQRLLVYTDYSFLEKVTKINVATLEQIVVTTFNLIDQNLEAPKPSYSQLFSSVIERFISSPVTSGNKEGIASMAITEVISEISRLKQLKEEEVILYLFWITSQAINPLPDLQQTILNRFKTTRYSKESLVVLSEKTAFLSGKKIWLFDRLINESDFKVLSQQKAFRMNFIKTLSNEQKQIVWKVVFSQEKQILIQTINEWAVFLQTSLNLSKNAQQKLDVFTQDLLILQLGKQWKSDDQQELLKEVFLFVTDVIAEIPLEVITTIKLQEISNHRQISTEGNKQWEKITTELLQVFEEEESRRNPNTKADNWAEEAIQFLLKGRSAFARSVSGATFKQKVAEAISYFLGGAKPEETWKDRDYYQSVVRKQVNNLSVLEINLILERLKQLAIPESEKSDLKKFMFSQHSIAEVILSDRIIDAILWLKADTNFTFAIQYLSKFDKLPLQINLDPEIFIRLTTLLFPEKIKSAVKILDIVAINQLTSLLQKASASSISKQELRSLEMTIKTISSGMDIPAKAKSITESSLLRAAQEIYTAIEQQLVKELKESEESRKKDETQKTKKRSDILKLDEELEKLAKKELENSLYVQNAGIVLLAPYLPRIFERLALLNEEGIFKNDESKIKAVEVIHFLTFGTEEMMEYTTILNKLMVAMPVSTPLETKISLNTEDKALCESLLKGVLQNWPSLKSSSIDNLRGTFLIREGKLTSHEDKYLLKVEEKGFDMLIDKVPWSFKLVKYKWMKKPVFVEWR